MNLSSLLDLFDHMAWADAEVWRAVLQSDAACQNAKLRETLLHQHSAQRVYLRVWRGEPLETPPQFEQMQEMCAWAKAYYGEGRAHIQSLTEAKLTEQAPAVWGARVEKALGPAVTLPTIGDTVLQVTLHSQYHRGQANARLRAVGETPPMIDHIVWVWKGRPAANWPE